MHPDLLLHLRRVLQQAALQAAGPAADARGAAVGLVADHFELHVGTDAGSWWAWQSVRLFHITMKDVVAIKEPVEQLVQPIVSPIVNDDPPEAVQRRVYTVAAQDLNIDMQSPPER